MTNQDPWLFRTEWPDADTDFEPAPYHHFLRVKKYKAHATCHMTQITEEAIQKMNQWSDNDGSDNDGSDNDGSDNDGSLDDLQWSLSLIISRVPIEREALPISPEAFENLCRNWNLSRLFARAHIQLPGCMMACPLPNPNSDWNGFIIRTDPKWSWSISMVISHDAMTHATYGLYICSDQFDIDRLFQNIESSCQVSHSFSYPTSVPLLLTDYAISEMFGLVRSHILEFQGILSSMKCNDYIELPSSKKEPDLVEYPRKMTALAVSSANIRTGLRSLHEVITLLKDQSEICDSVPHLAMARRSIEQQISLLCQFLESTEQLNKFVSEGVQAQVQMVYAHSAQRDNENSLRLAKLSQERNDQNFKIAQFTAHESRMSTIMARSAVSHGLDMRLISLVTLLFLPGTFMATLFSAGFWNFEPGNKGPVVSKWAWVYLVLTVVLTVAVLAAWRYLSGQRKKEELSMEGKVDLSFLEGVEDDEKQSSGALPNPPPVINATPLPQPPTTAHPNQTSQSIHASGVDQTFIPGTGS